MHPRELIDRLLGIWVFLPYWVPVEIRMQLIDDIYSRKPRIMRQVMKYILEHEIKKQSIEIARNKALLSILGNLDEISSELKSEYYEERAKRLASTLLHAEREEVALSIRDVQERKQELDSDTVASHLFVQQDATQKVV